MSLKDIQKDQEAILRALLSEQPVLGIAILQDGVFKFTNCAVSEILGIPFEEALKWNPNEFTKVIHPDDLSVVLEQAQQTQLGSPEPIAQYAFRVITKTGDIKWVEVFSKKIIYNGRPADFVTYIDITDRKKAEDILKASEERYRLIFSMSSDAVTLHEITPEGFPGKYIEVNDVMCQRLGYSREELLNLSPMDIIEEETTEDISKLMGQLFDAKHLVFERVHVTKDGQKIPVEINAHFFELNGHPTALAIIRDITDRKKAEIALRTSEERYRILFEDAPIAIDESNYSGVKRYLDQLREQGVTDLRTYIEQNPKVALDCVELVRVVSTNKICMELYQAQSQVELERRFTQIPSKEIYEVFKNLLFTFIEGKSVYEAEFTTVTIKGLIRHVFAKWTIVPGYEDTWEKILTSMVDITERVHAEAAVQESEEKYRILFETAPDVIGITSPEGRFIDVNPATFELFGYTREEMQQLHVEEIYADPTDLIKFQQEVQEKGFVKDYEQMLKKKDGTIMHCLTTSTVRRTASGEILGYQNVIRDISARKHTEAALQREKDRFQQYLNVAGVFILAIDRERRITLINKKGREILGYPEAEILGKTFEGFMPEHSRSIAKTRFKRMIEESDDLSTFYAEYPILTKNGEERLLGWNNSPIINDHGKIIGLLSSGEDITEQKRAEITLKESEARYRILFEDAPISLWEEDFSAVKQYLDQLRQQGVTDFRTFFEQNPEAIVHCVTQVNVIDVNKATLTLYKAEAKEDLFGDLISQAFTKESYDDYKEGIIAFTEGKMVFETETIRKTLAGKKIHLVVRWSCPPGYEDTWEKVFVSLLDITDRKKAEKALQESENALRSSEERFRRLAEASFEGIVISKQLRIVDANHNAARMFGYRLPEIIGMSLLDLIAPESRESAQSHIHTQSELTYEGIGLRKDGSTFPYEAHGRATLFQGQPARVSALRDITAQRQMEEARKELEEQQAEFVSVTSHELRTPLTAIRGYTELMEQKMNEFNQEQWDQCFQAIRRNIKRLEGLVSSVSTLGQLERGLFNLNLKNMDLKAFLLEALQPYQSFLHEQLEVQHNLEGDVFINGDSDRLLQVLNNLLENAVKHTSKTDRRISVELKLLPQTVQIQIVDNGAGITPENLERIFEPYVSIPTTFSAIGSGIGLYLARKITEAHGGALIAHSEGKGRGATFTVELPRIY